MRNILGSIWQKIWMFPDHKRTTQLKFLRNWGKSHKKLLQEFSGTEIRIPGALARHDDFFMNPLNQGHSGTAPETSRNVFSISQVTNEDDSQSNPHPEAGLLNNQTTQNSGPEDRHDMVTGGTEQTRNRHDMATWATERIWNRHDMVTGSTEQIRSCHDMIGVHEGVTYCSTSTSSGKQKNSRSTSQPQIRSENTPATIGADPILLALERLANNNKSVNFHNIINRISKLPESLTTTMPMLDGKSEIQSISRSFPNESQNS